jgi:hypothetical protein
VEARIPGDPAGDLQLRPAARARPRGCRPQRRSTRRQRSRAGWCCRRSSSARAVHGDAGQRCADPHRGRLRHLARHELAGRPHAPGAGRGLRFRRPVVHGPEPLALALRLHWDRTRRRACSAGRPSPVHAGASRAGGRDAFPTETRQRDRVLGRLLCRGRTAHARGAPQTRTRQAPGRLPGASAEARV